MRYSLLLSIFLILFFTSCSEDPLCPALPIAEGTITNQNEYDIVETIINSEFKAEEFLHVSQGPILNADSASIYKYVTTDEITFEPASINEYLNFNSTPYVWGDQFPSSKELINHDELLCHFEIERDGWTGYYDKYEDSEGFLVFARPYINSMGEAYIEFEKLCGSLCGYGYIAILQKEDDNWVVKKVKLTWIS